MDLFYTNMTKQNEGHDVPQQMGKYTILPVYPIFIWKLFLT